MEETYLTVSDVAKMFRIRKETVRRYIREGHLKALSLPGGDYRIQGEDVRLLLQDNNKTPARS